MRPPAHLLLFLFLVAASSPPSVPTFCIPGCCPSEAGRRGAVSVTAGESLD